MFSSVQLLSRVQLFATPWTAACQAPSLSPRVCSDSCPLRHAIQPSFSVGPLLLPSVFLSIRDFSNVLALRIRWPKHWSFSISPSNEYSGLISFRIDWLDLLAVQGTLKSLLQRHSWKASVLRVLSFFIARQVLLPPLLSLAVLL